MIAKRVFIFQYSRICCFYSNVQIANILNENISQEKREKFYLCKLRRKSNYKYLEKTKGYDRQTTGLSDPFPGLPSLFIFKNKSLLKITIVFLSPPLPWVCWTPFMDGPQMVSNSNLSTDILLLSEESTGS